MGGLPEQGQNTPAHEIVDKAFHHIRLCLVDHVDAEIDRHTLEALEDLRTLVQHLLEASKDAFVDVSLLENLEHGVALMDHVLENDGKENVENDEDATCPPGRRNIIHSLLNVKGKVASSTSSSTTDDNESDTKNSAFALAAVHPAPTTSAQIPSPRLEQAYRVACGDERSNEMKNFSNTVQEKDEEKTDSVVVADKPAAKPHPEHLIAEETQNSQTIWTNSSHEPFQEKISRLSQLETNESSVSSLSSSEFVAEVTTTVEVIPAGKCCISQMCVTNSTPGQDNRSSHRRQSQARLSNLSLPLDGKLSTLLDLEQHNAKVAPSLSQLVPTRRSRKSLHRQTRSLSEVPRVVFECQPSPSMSPASASKRTKSRRNDSRRGHHRSCGTLDLEHSARLIGTTEYQGGEDNTHPLKRESTSAAPPPSAGRRRSSRRHRKIHSCSDIPPPPGDGQSLTSSSETLRTRVWSYGEVDFHPPLLEQARLSRATKKPPLASSLSKYRKSCRCGVLCTGKCQERRNNNNNKVTARRRSFCFGRNV